jgi:acyl-CoA thioester hydrolase
VTDAYCRYRNAARYDETITIRTWMKEMKRRMITFEYEIFRPENQEVIAEGETRHLSIDMKGKPRSLPEEFAIRLAG